MGYPPNSLEIIWYVDELSMPMFPFNLMDACGLVSHPEKNELCNFWRFT